MTSTAHPTASAVDEPQRCAKRVLWVTKGLGRGGAERLTVDCARAFDRTHWTVDVAYVLPYKDALVGELRVAGIGVHCVGDRTRRWSWVPALWNLVRDRGYDLVHTHSPVPAVTLRAVPGRWRPPIVHTEHNLWARYHPVTRWCNALTFGRNAGAVAVSESVARSASPPFGAPPPAVLRHGIDVAKRRHGPRARHAARKALALSPDAIVIGTVANFTPKKDHATLLRAVGAVVERHPTVRLVLIGAGPLEGELRARTQALELGSVVVFAGSRDDVAEILPAFDLFALSSRHEGLPIALLEAMSSGVPPVATAVGGIPEVITDGVDGRLVPAGDPDALMAALTDLLGSPDRRMALAEAARRRAADFDITRAVREMERWYEEILA